MVTTDIRVGRRALRPLPEPDRPLPADRREGARDEHPARDRRPTRPMLRELWEEFEARDPGAARVRRDLGRGVAGRRAPTSAGAASSTSPRTTRASPARCARRCSPGDVWHIVFAYVRPRARRRGVLQALLREAIAEGREPRVDARHARRAGRERRGGRGLAAARLRAGSSYDGRAARRSLERTAGRRATGAVARRDLRPDRRPRRGRAGGREVPAADRPLRRRRPSPSRATAGRGSTTSSAAATRRRCAGSAASSRSRSARSCSRSAIEEGAVVRYILWDRGGDRRRVRVGARVLRRRCRPATSSRSPRTRRSRSG